ncbi:hypothetical protein LTR37_014785 [Vermiconidia calcicola]|uniref:Uncharacterized protein n=1 Tax=Vermiconidia calcicola TaxID=1690605 RepID=A0ACC3MSQ6_9PEZI|nr:hypothetical protein LTR37_014785 [Vermiconidia calcicola]
MNERNFQQQLHTLKSRLCELSQKYPPQPQQMLSPQNSFRTPDPFMEQLRGVKLQLAHMEESLFQHERSVQQRYGAQTYVPRPAVSSSSDSRQWNQIALPSGPLFWQLYNTLRTDMQGLDSRVAEIERNLSNLEDRVDEMNPNRFTPASSTANSDVAYMKPIHVNSHSLPLSQHAPVSELYSDANGLEENIPIPIEQNWTSWAGQCPPSNQNILGHYPQQPSCDEWPKAHQPWNDRNINTEISSTDVNINRLKEENTTMMNQIGKLDHENAKLLRAVQTLGGGFDRILRLHEPAGTELPAMAMPNTAPEGVVFRDQEIARMDEQLRIAHDQVRVSEGVANQKDALIAQLRSERYDFHRHAALVGAMETQMKQYRGELAARDMECYGLQDAIANKDNEVRAWQDKHHEIVQAFKHARAEGQARQDYMREQEEHNDQERAKLVANHHDELRQMKEFCEQKDAVIHRQEDVISRGARLLEQRDEELEGIQRNLRVVEDDRDYAARTGERIARLLGERDSEIARLKSDSDKAPVKHIRRNTEHLLDGINETLLEVPEGSDGSSRTASYRPPPSVQSEQSTPTHAQGFNSPRSVEHRAYIWANDLPGTVHQEPKYPDETPSPGDRSIRGRAPGRNRRNSNRRYPELVKQPSVSPETQDARGWKSGSRADMGSRWQALDNRTFRPPLPAPVTARRQASEANLRPTSPNNATQKRKTVAKHQSMLELGKLQPYVETEGEEGGEV